MIARKLLTRLVVASLAFALAGCGGSTSVPATLVASANAEGMVLTNRTSVAVNFVAMSEKSAPLIDWIPTPDPRIAPGASLTVPRAAILGFAEGGNPVLVYWWGVRPASGGGYELAPGVNGTLRVSGL